MEDPAAPMLPDANGILFAYALHGDGTARRLAAADIAGLVGRKGAGDHKREDLVWVHMDARHAGTRSWLEQAIGHVDPLIVDALLAEETRPRMLEFPEGMLVILRGVNLNPDADPEDMVSIRLWIDGLCVITMRRRPLISIEDIRQLAENGKGPREGGDFLSMLCVRLQERMEPVVAALDDDIDDLEERILETPDIRLRTRVTGLRMRAIMLRRYFAPQRDVIQHLRNSDKKWINTKDKRHLQESADRLTRYVEDLDAVRERAQIVKDELTHASSERMNRNMFVLSIVSAVFLPLTFLTGLIGMNVDGIPHANNPHAFMVIGGICAGIAVFEVILFKIMRWF